VITLNNTAALKSVLFILFFGLTCVICDAAVFQEGAYINTTNASTSFISNTAFDIVVVKDNEIDFHTSDGWSNLTTVPSNHIDMTISKWNMSGDYRKVWNESSVAHDTVTTHTITGYPVNTMSHVIVDGAPYSTQLYDGGSVSWVYYGGYSNHTFDVIIEPDRVVVDVTPASPSSTDNLKIININTLGVYVTTGTSMFGRITSVISEGYILLSFLAVIIGAIAILRYLN
jgi:hypothetical protein